MISKRGWVWALLALCALAEWAVAQDFDDMMDSGVLRVGVYRDFAPYSFEVDGEPKGVDVALAKVFADDLGLKLDLVWMTPDETLEDDLRNYVWKGHYLDKDDSEVMHQKRVSDVMLRVPYDHEYAYRLDAQGLMVNERVVMFGPYQQETWRVAFDSTRIDSVDTMAVFQYHSIGVEVDSVPSFYLSSAFQGRMRNQVHHYPNLTAAFSAMQSGDVYAVMGMQAEVEWLLHESADPKLAKASNGFPLLGKQVWEIGMAVKDDNRPLSHHLSSVVERLVLSGEMAKIYSQYGLSYRVPEYYKPMLMNQ